MTDKKPIILFKLPSRGRPERFFKALDSIVLNLACDYAYHISCTLDEDDTTMNNDEVVSKIAAYKNTSIEWGASKSKIDAINRSMPEVPWDILVVCSDDIYFNVYGFDELIRNEMSQHFADNDGFLHFHEKDSGAALCVMSVMGKKYYDRFGYIYHPDFRSLFADNEATEVAKILGKYIYINYSIMEHLNPAYGYIERDEMFDEQQQVGWTIDQQTYNRRKEKNFDL